MKAAQHAGRRQALRVALGWGAGLAGLSAPAAARPARAALPSTALQWRERALLALGTTVWLRAGHASAEVADTALAAAGAAVQQVEMQMSLFRPTSALCCLNRDGVLHAPPPELVVVLRLAQRVAARSAGRFDPTVQPLWQLWQRTHAAGRRPTTAELHRARQLVGWRGVNVQDDVIRLARPGMALTLNGIAQGHAAGMARRALQRHGIEHALLDTGEWLPLGGAPAQTGASAASAAANAWRLGVADPHQPGRLLGALQGDGRALACSSDDKLAFSADRRDHHILDPRSGRSPTQLSMVVVAAHDAALADALTKPMFMGSAQAALALARDWRVDALVVDKAGHIAASPGLRFERAG